MFHKFLFDAALFYITYLENDVITGLEKNFPSRICDIRLTNNVETNPELFSLQTKILNQFKDLSLWKNDVDCEHCLIHFKESVSEIELDIKNILNDVFLYLDMISLDQILKDARNPIGFYEDYNDTLNKLRQGIFNLEQAENSMTSWKEALSERTLENAILHLRYSYIKQFMNINYE